jgi:hypothetical protein
VGRPQEETERVLGTAMDRVSTYVHSLDYNSLAPLGQDGDGAVGGVSLFGWLRRCRVVSNEAGEDQDALGCLPNAQGVVTDPLMMVRAIATRVWAWAPLHLTKRRPP